MVKTGPSGLLYFLYFISEMVTSSILAWTTEPSFNVITSCAFSTETNGMAINNSTKNLFISFFLCPTAPHKATIKEAWHRIPLLYFGGRENYPYDEMRQTVHAISASHYTALHHNWKFLTFPKYKTKIQRFDDFLLKSDAKIRTFSDAHKFIFLPAPRPTQYFPP